MAGIITAAATKFGATASTAGKIGTITATGLQVGGLAASIIGTLQAGKAQSAQSEFESQLAKSQAIQEEIRATEEARLRRKAGEKLESRQRAQFARAGIRVGEGTPLLIMAETALDTAEDISFIKEAGVARSDAFRLRARTFRDIGKTAKTASRFKAGADLLSGLDALGRSNP